MIDPKLQKVIGAPEERAVFGVTGGPVCGHFSVAVPPPVTSTEHRLFQNIAEIGIAKGLGVWVENPSVAPAGCTSSRRVTSTLLL